MIKENVRQKMYDAMKAHDKAKKDAYNFLLGQLMKAEKDMQTKDNPNPVLSEAEEIAVIQKIVKQTKEAIKLASDGGKDDFVAARQFELDIYAEFLPEEMSEEEIKAIIEEVIASLPAPINKGVLMKNLMPKVKGKADGKLVAALVDQYLAK